MGLNCTSSLCNVGKKWISVFVSEVQQASWRRADDVLKAFPRLEPIENNLYKISILETNCYMVLKFNFENQIVLIKEIKSFH